MTVTDKQQLLKALQAIAEGYPIDVHYDYLIRVANPDFNEPWDDPYIVIDMSIMRNILKD